MPGLYDADVIVIGAGLTGLRAALEVSRAGLTVLVFERGDHLGGRMSTQVVDGFKLDRGFQVLLSEYPEIKRLKNIDRLNCRSFSSGARVRYKGRFVDFYDPLHHPDKLLDTLTAPIASLKDLLLTFMLTRGVGSTCRPLALTTARGLERYGFSERFQEGFLKPFLRGVLLDPPLRADFGLARFYLKMFATGEAALPYDGIQGLPNALADQVGRSHIRLESPVNAISATEVSLENGDTYTAQHVVCAVDTMAATQLGSPEQTLNHVGSSTLYFSASTPPFEERIVVVSAEAGPISTLAVVSNVQPSYAPAGKALIAVTVLGDVAALPESELVSKVIQQATAWYGKQVSGWKLLSCIQIPAAVVTRPRMSSGYIERNGVFYAGDYLAYPSQNGALQAGRLVGEAVVERLA